MKDIIEKIDKTLLKKVLIFTFLIGLIAHAYCYLNSSFSHDSMSYVYNHDLLIYISVSRFIRPLLLLIKGRWIYPWLNGLLSLLYISITCYFLITILEIKNNYSIFLLCAILSTNASLTLLSATYIQDLDMNMFALMLSIIATYLLINNKNNKLINYLISILIIVLSLGIYQTYIGFVITLFLFIYFKKIINRENIKDATLFIIEKYFIVFVSCIIYFMASKLIMAIFGVSVSSTYNEISSVLSKSINQLLEGISLSLEATINFIRYPNSNNTRIIALINLLLLIFSIITIVKIIIKNRINLSSVILISFILLLMPFTCNITTILSGMYHDLTTYPLVLFYIFIIMLLEIYSDYRKNKYSYIVIMSLFIFVFDNCTYSNRIYLKKDLELKNTISVYTRIIDRIEQIESYIPGETPVAFIGTLDKSELVKYRDDMSYYGTGLWENFSVTNNHSATGFINNYLNYPMNIVQRNDLTYLTDIDEITEMSCFPNADSIKKINGTIIVKLSSD